MRKRPLILASVLVCLLVSACDDTQEPTPQMNSGPEQTADEAGVYSTLKPQTMTAVIEESHVTITWKHFGYAVDFIVLRRDVNAPDNWEELHVHVNPFPDPTLLPFLYTDTAALRGSTYVYGVKARNYSRQGVLIESTVVETAPVAVR